jgi:hypothetical protein
VEEQITGTDIMKTTITIISLSAILACLTLLAQESPRPASNGLADRFKQLDTVGTDANAIR